MDFVNQIDNLIAVRLCMPPQKREKEGRNREGWHSSVQTGRIGAAN
jgi:hypothetical protein